MRLSPQQVSVRKIVAREPRSAFPSTELETAARLILEAGGLTLPVVVRRSGPEAFELLAGAFPYYAASRARELAPQSLATETVPAFVLEGDSPALLRQAEFWQRPQGRSPAIGVPAEGHGDRLTEMERRIEQLLTGFGRKLDEERSAARSAQEAFQDEIVSYFPRPLPALRLLNEAEPLELLAKLREGGLKGKSAQAVCQAILENRPYGSLRDAASRIKGLSAQRLLSLVDAWSERVVLTAKLGALV